MRVYDRNGLLKVNQTIVPTTFQRGAQWISVSSAIAVPVNHVDVQIPYVCSLKKVMVLTEGGLGSCRINVWSTPYTAFPPGAGNDITGGNDVVLSSVIKYTDAVLAGWTTSFNTDDVIRFNLASSSLFTRVFINLEFQ